MLEYVAMNPAAAGNESREDMGGSGIAAYLDRSLVETIGDITPDQAEAERLADMLNRFEVSLIHFHDVVEDYIAQR